MPDTQADTHDDTQADTQGTADFDKWLLGQIKSYPSITSVDTIQPARTLSMLRVAELKLTCSFYKCKKIFLLYWEMMV